MVGASLLLHAFTVLCFSVQPERLAAFTVLPIWFWGGIGLVLSSLAFFCLRAPLSVIVTLIWALTLVAGSDEAKVLGNFRSEPPQPGPPEKIAGASVMRVITLNCSQFIFGNPAEDLVAWQPDVVLLQEVDPFKAMFLAGKLYGTAGSLRFHNTGAVLTRWKIVREICTPGVRGVQVTISRPDGFRFEVSNIHLLSAATDLRFWRRKTWRDHHVNRLRRVREISTALHTLESTTGFPHTPAIIGGDFNAPAGDITHRVLARDFTDSFAAVGTGWGDTYQRRFPVLRIDAIHASRHFIPVRSRAVKTRFSDHRMVVSDFLAN